MRLQGQTRTRSIAACLIQSEWGLPSDTGGRGWERPTWDLSLPFPLQHQRHRQPSSGHVRLPAPSLSQVLPFGADSDRQALSHEPRVQLVGSHMTPATLTPSPHPEAPGQSPQCPMHNAPCSVPLGQAAHYFSWPVPCPQNPLHPKVTSHSQL